jgi:hypothetical protein
MVYLCGYAEPSLVFYLKGDFEILNGPGYSQPYAGPPRQSIYVVSSRSTDVIARLAMMQYTQRATVTGFNFAKGRREEVSVWLSPELELGLRRVPQ